MKKAKFWLAQIAMVALVSLVFGSPVFADPSSTAVEKRQGAQSDNASDQGKAKANSNAKGFEEQVGTDDAPTCTQYFNGQCYAWE